MERNLVRSENVDGFSILLEQHRRCLLHTYWNSIRLRLDILYRKSHQNYHHHIIGHKCCRYLISKTYKLTQDLDLNVLTRNITQSEETGWLRMLMQRVLLRRLHRTNSAVQWLGQQTDNIKIAICMCCVNIFDISPEQFRTILIYKVISHP